MFQQDQTIHAEFRAGGIGLMMLSMVVVVVVLEVLSATENVSPE